MKYTFKILAVVSGLALAMTAAYASSQAPVARPAATLAWTPPIVVPAALSPGFIPICFVLGGQCLTPSACAARNGTPGTQIPNCPAGTLCCLLDL